MNRGTLMLAAVCALALGVQAASAAKLYKWVDENGNVTYQDSPPPEGARYEEGTLSEPTDAASTPADAASNNRLRDAVANNPVVVYTAPDCVVCGMVTTYLQEIRVPFQMKNVVGDADYQQELLGVSGKLEVPTILVGEQIMSGFNKDLIDRELEVAGYPSQITREDSAAVNEELAAEEELRRQELEQAVEEPDATEEELTEIGDTGELEALEEFTDEPFDTDVFSDTDLAGESN